MGTTTSGSSKTNNVGSTPSKNDFDTSGAEKTTHCMQADSVDFLNSPDDANELKEMQRQWKKEAPNGTITKKEFKDFLREIGLVDDFLQDMIFNAFDNNKDGQITFKEFVESLSVLTRGTPEEKLKFAFDMYDLDRDGFISKPELIQVMTALQKATGPLTSPSGKTYASPDHFATEFFDSVEGGKMSLAAYKEIAQKNHDIFECLKLSTPGLCTDPLKARQR